MTRTTLDQDAVSLAIAKAAYLAACLLLNAIPCSPKSDALRAELIAARDLPQGSSPQLGPEVRALRVGRSEGAPQPGEILLMQATSTTSTPRYSLGFNRAFNVSWPIEDAFLSSLARAQ